MSLPRHEDSKPSLYPEYKLLCFKNKLSFNSRIYWKKTALEFHLSTDAVLLEFSLLKDRVSREGMRDGKGILALRGVQVSIHLQITFVT